MKKDFLPFKTFGGAKVPHHKNTSHIKTVTMPIPDIVTIPMSQHIGAPCKPIVKKGEYVTVGQIIGESVAFVSAPIHSSISGTVSDVKPFAMPNGQIVDAVTIKSDGEMTICENIKPLEMPTNKSELLEIVKNSGLVGLGGAGFPTHVKLNTPADRKMDFLLINAAECEPYITSDNREALENTENVIKGIQLVKNLLDIKTAMIGVEDNKPEAIKKLKDTISQIGDDSISVVTLKASYPQGAEKVLIMACTNRMVPAGKLPSDVGCVVMNIASTGFLYSHINTGIPLVSKRLTIDGSAIKEPTNIIVPIGTQIKDITEYIGGYKDEVFKILLGGPMMGTAVTSDEFPIVKQNNAILCLAEKEAKLLEPTDCIRCGRCVKACPMNLMPIMFDKYTEKSDTEELTKLEITSCIECGCCSFSCPAGKRLVQSIRLGKNLVRKASAK